MGGRLAGMRSRPARLSLREIFEGVHPDHRSVDGVLSCRLCSETFWSRIAKLQALDRGGANGRRALDS